MTTTKDTLTAVPGFRVGHQTHVDAVTGCTVILCPDGTVGGVDVRGGAPGTRETDLLRPTSLVETVNAIVLSGGSAFGLATADGVVQWLEEKGIGYPSGTGFTVPIVSGAILMDLPIGEPYHPDAAMGRAACENASDAPIEQGSVGAGTGCRVGMMMGNDMATKSGIGSACIDIGDGLKVAALVAVNALGDVLDETGQIMAGMRSPTGDPKYADTLEFMKSFSQATSPPTSNTVIGAIATNAQLSKAHVNKVAQMAHNGIARAVRPAHTMYDGDVIFALASGQIAANVNVIGAYGAEAMAAAIRSAVRQAQPLGGVPTWDQ